MSRPAKRPRLELSLSDKVKLHVIREQEYLSKLSQRELSDKFKIDKSTVGDILKKKQVYLHLYEKMLAQTYPDSTQHASLLILMTVYK
jgi:predicted DNA-binding protein YlxM (UPF0122 family)